MDISTVRIAGPQRLTYKGIDIGHTLDGVELSIEREFEDVKVDRYASAIDKVLTGTKCTVKFKLAQDQIRTWDIAMPETSTYDGATDRADIGADTGYSMRNDAGLLVVHPLSRVTSDFTEDINIYKAVSVENIEVPYKIDEQKVVEITMEALIDESYASGRRLGHIGPAAVS